MAKSTKLVPRLRFPGFTGEWVNRQMDDICEFASSKRVFLSEYVAEGIPFYRGKEISELKRGIYPSDILFITVESYRQFKEKYGVPIVGDILITAVGTLGNVYRVSNDSPFYFKDGNLIWIRNIQELPHFLEVILENNKRNIEKSSIGSTQRALTMVELRKLIFSFPTLPEQQKIAAFLSAVDQKIQQLTRKKELLELYKKGVMQKIFSREIRFKDAKGKAFPDWEEKKLGEVGKIVTGKTPLTSDSENWSGEIPFITPSDIDGNIKYQDYTERFVAENLVKNILPTGSIAYTCIASIGKMSILTQPSITNQQINSIIPAESIVGEYLFYVLLFNTPKIKAMQSNTTLPIINKTDFSNILVRISNSKSEQSQIAACLSVIDSKIGVLLKTITQTQSYKKALLQQMFV